CEPFPHPVANGYAFGPSPALFAGPFGERLSRRHASMSVRTVRLLLALLVLVCWLVSPTSGNRTDQAVEWVTASEGLVLFNTKLPDEDGNGQSDSQDVAEYYAARRGIPPDHLLGLSLSDRRMKIDRLSYPEFFRRVLVPTRQRVADLAAKGVNIHYL